MEVEIWKDAIEIARENKEGVRVAFAMGKLQCYTRWNNLSEMVKNLMTEAVEYHFGIYTTPQDRVAFG